MMIDQNAMVARIRKKSGMIAGSGFFGKTGDTCYLLTAKHVLNDFTEGWFIELLSGSETITYPIPYGNQMLSENLDLAIVKMEVNIEERNHDIYELIYTDYCYEDELVIKGYPGSMTDQEGLAQSIKELKSRVETDIPDMLEFKVGITSTYSLSGNSTALDGLSGAGACKVQNNEVYLVGVFCKSPAPGEYAVVNCISISEAQKLLEANNLPGLIYAENVPTSFDEYSLDLFNMIPDGKVKVFLQGTVDDLLNEIKYVPSMCSRANNDIEQLLYCVSECPQRCPYRWRNRLLYLTIMCILDFEPKDFIKPNYKQNGHDFILDFLCTEGLNNQNHITGAIRSIHRAEKRGFNSFADGSTLIWSSNKPVYSLPVSRDKYEGTIKDIMYESASDKKVYLDILKGIVSKNSYNIIPIDTIIQKIAQLEEDDIDKMIEGIKEVIEFV